MKTIQNRKLKLSRRDEIRRNPLPWIILLIISISIIVFSLFPKYQSWQEKKEGIDNLTKTNLNLESQNESKREKKDEIERRFNETKESFVDIENQIFPNEIEEYKIVRILETFSILMKNLESVLFKDSHFELESLTFSKPKKVGEKTETNLNIKFSANDENIRQFVKYLQKGILPENFIKMESNSDLLYLEDNLLPLMHINSIKISEEKSTNKELTVPHFSVQLQVILFSH